LLGESEKAATTVNSGGRQRRVLLYGDIDLNIIDGSAIWLIAMAEALSWTKSEVHLVIKAPVHNMRLLDQVRDIRNVHIHQPVILSPRTQAGMSCKEARARLEQLDGSIHPDVIIARGLEICAAIANSPALANRLWCYITDMAFPRGMMSEGQRVLLHQTMTVSRRVFAQTEDARAYIEAMIPVAAGKCLILNPIIPDGLLVNHASHAADSGPLRLVYAGKFARNWRTLEICELSLRLADHGIAAEVTLIGDKFQKDPDDPTWHHRMREAVQQPSVNWLGGMGRDEALAIVRNSDVGLSWRSSALNDSLEISTKVLEYAAAGVPPLLNRTQAHEELLGADYPLFIEHDSTAEIARVLSIGRNQLNEIRRQVRAAVQCYSMSEAASRLEGYLDRAEVDPPVRSPRSRPLRVVVAGHDFKFVGELLDLLESRSDIDLRLDRWRSLYDHEDAVSEELLAWADVVFCEWAGPNAVWYAARKRTDQRLIVRLHLFELAAPWLGDLAFEAVDTLVTVSPLLRRRTANQMGWDEDKIIIIPNTLDTHDLDRPKLPGAEFHLGIVGIVPFRKRPERAVDVLQQLLNIDPRFTLHIRGRMPWEYRYVWNKPSEREAYLAFFERFASSTRLPEHVAFEPFGADMGNWLRKVGFVLSPSTSESFHLAPAEGMASGSIPVVWQRDGAHDIFPERFIVPDTTSAAHLILDYANDGARRTADGERVKAEAEAWDVAEVGARWLQCLTEKG
jgi:glycosyltransferase involved in cell wall biosynthesis